MNYYHFLNNGIVLLQRICCL